MEGIRIANPQVDFGKAIGLGFSNFFNISGRSRRSEYWWWTLFSVLLGWFTFGLGILVTFIPSVTLSVRRLHDVGRSGWTLLLPWFCTIVSAIVIWVGIFNTSTAVIGLGVLLGFCSFVANYLFVLSVSDSKPEENKWGLSPKYASPEECAVFMPEKKVETCETTRAKTNEIYNENHSENNVQNVILATYVIGGLVIFLIQSIVFYVLRHNYYYDRMTTWATFFGILFNCLALLVPFAAKGTKWKIILFSVVVFHIIMLYVLPMLLN